MATAKITVEWRTTHEVEVPDNYTPRDVEQNFDEWADQDIRSDDPSASIINWDCSDVTIEAVD